MKKIVLSPGKTLLRVFFLWCIMYAHATVLHAQKYQDDYIIQDSAKRVGIKLERGSDAENAQYVQLKTSTGTIRFGPDKVDEYLIDNRLYKSMRIPEPLDNQSLYFLEQLFIGYPTIYYVKPFYRSGHYYFQEEEQAPLVLLSEDSKALKSQLHDLLTGCDQTDQNIDRIQITKQQLSALLESHDGCQEIGVRKIKIGLGGGYQMHTYSNNSLPGGLSETNLGQSWAPYISAALDIPIFGGNFSLHTSLSYSHFNQRISTTPQNTKTGFDIFFSDDAIGVSPVLRYHKPKPGIALFGEIGGSVLIPILDYQRVDEFVEQGFNLFTQRELDVILVPDYLIGPTCSFGIIINYPKRINYSIGIRYDPLYLFSIEQNGIRFSQFSLSGGVYF